MKPVYFTLCTFAVGILFALLDHFVTTVLVKVIE
jgi:hypothetical protein